MLPICTIPIYLPHVNSCDMIYNKYIVFDPTSGIELLMLSQFLNDWNFLSDECDKGIFSYVNEVSFVNTKDGGWLPKESALSLESWN